MMRGCMRFRLTGCPRDWTMETSAPRTESRYRSYIPPGKLAVGMPARVIRDAPGKVKDDKRRPRDETEG